jgi:hypothetical protein
MNRARRVRIDPARKTEGFLIIEVQEKVGIPAEMNISLVGRTDRSNVSERV